VSSFVQKRCEVETESIPSVGGGLGEVGKFATGRIGSGPFGNLEKSRSWSLSNALIEMVCCASIVDGDHKVCIITDVSLVLVRWYPYWK